MVESISSRSASKVSVLRFSGPAPEPFSWLEARSRLVLEPSSLVGAGALSRGTTTSGNWRRSRFLMRSLKLKSNILADYSLSQLENGQIEARGKVNIGWRNGDESGSDVNNWR